MWNEAVRIEPSSLAFVPDIFKTEEMCNEAVGRNVYTLDNVPDYIMTQKVCNEVVRENPAFFLVPDCFKTQRMCIMALEVFPWQLNDIPDYFNTQRVSDDVVQRDAHSLQFVPDWFVTEEQMKIWDDDDDHYDDNEIIEWCDGYQKRKFQKAKIKEELLPIACIPIVWWIAVCQKMRKKR